MSASRLPVEDYLPEERERVPFKITKFQQEKHRFEFFLQENKFVFDLLN